MSSEEYSYLFHPILGMEIGIGLMANIYALYFIYFELKVHKHIRKHLIVASIEYCMGITAMGIGYVLNAVVSGINGTELASCMLYSISLSQCLMEVLWLFLKLPACYQEY